MAQMDEKKTAQLFMQLVIQNQQMAMIALGKIKNPVTDKTDKNIEFAKVFAPDADSLIVDGVRANFTREGEYIIYNSSTEVESENDEKMPVIIKLEQNFPNPFNSSAIIKYTIGNSLITGARQSREIFVTMKIYDALGSEVAELANETQTSGNYEVLFDASQLSSGIYYCRLRAGSFVKIIKMILMK